MLTVIEGRVMGCLLEKERTVPDQYPLTLNTLVSACNQSTSREPVMHLDEHEIDATLTSLKSLGLLRFVHPAHGRSVTRYRQVANEKWELEVDATAIVPIEASKVPVLLRAAVLILICPPCTSALTVPVFTKVNAPPMGPELSRMPVGMIVPSVVSVGMVVIERVVPLLTMMVIGCFSENDNDVWRCVPSWSHGTSPQFNTKTRIISNTYRVYG